MTMSDCMYEAHSPETPPMSPLFKDIKEAKSKTKAPSKYIPHKDKPPQLVAKRNARERRR